LVPDPLLVLGPEGFEVPEEGPLTRRESPLLKGLDDFILAEALDEEAASL